MSRFVQDFRSVFAALSVASCATAGSAQAQDGNTPAPRGAVAADCYARMELWQGDVRSPVRLLFTRVMYHEMAGGGVARDLSSQWNKFISPRLTVDPAQQGQNRIVYCRYADAPNNTEIARWPTSLPAPEEVNWPGRSVAWQAVVPVAAAPAFAPVPDFVAQPATPTAAPVPKPVTTPAVQAVVSKPADTGTIDGDLAGLPAAPEGMAYNPEAVAAYQQQMQAYQQKLASDQAVQAARAEVVRQQQEAYQRELAAAQEARRKYEAERAAYEAELAKSKR